jgi:hypothetical protein
MLEDVGCRISQDAVVKKKAVLPLPVFDPTKTQMHNQFISQYSLQYPGPANTLKRQSSLLIGVCSSSILVPLDLSSSSARSWLSL